MALIGQMRQRGYLAPWGGRQQDERRPWAGLLMCVPMRTQMLRVRGGAGWRKGCSCWFRHSCDWGLTSPQRLHRLGVNHIGGTGALCTPSTINMSPQIIFPAGRWLWVSGCPVRCSWRMFSHIPRVRHDWATHTHTHIHTHTHTLASTHPTSVAPSPSCDNQQCPQTLSKVPWDGKASTGWEPPFGAEEGNLEAER